VRVHIGPFPSPYLRQMSMIFWSSLRVCSLDWWLIKRGSGWFEGGGIRVSRPLRTLDSGQIFGAIEVQSAGSDSSVQLRASKSCFESDAM
jgi:hypothetical protein